MGILALYPVANGSRCGFPNFSHTGSRAGWTRVHLLGRQSPARAANLRSSLLCSEYERPTGSIRAPVPQGGEVPLPVTGNAKLCPFGG